MTIQHIQDICKSFPGVTEDIKWEAHLCFNIGEKMFLITAPDEVPVSASFKVSDDEFEEISVRKGFSPAPYLARYKWVQVDDLNRLSQQEWKSYLKKAYDLVFARLPKNVRSRIK